MSTNVKQSAAGSARFNDGQNLPSLNIRDQVFLKALQDLIVHVVDPRRMNDQIPLGLEAGKLITALHDFVSTMVGRSESMTKDTVVKMNLVEENNALQRKYDDDSKGVSLTPISSIKLHGDSNENGDNDSIQHLGEQYWSLFSTFKFEAKDPIDNLDLLENPEPTFHDKLLKALREHVFNMMPIRMLSFESHESSLQITLVERGAIHSRLASVLQAKIHEADHVPIFSASSNEMETEQQAIDRLISKYARYAILSHTWLHTSGEVTHADWNKGLFDAEDPGYKKLVNFCKIAWKDHGLALGWMDTVCINKDSSSELDESIRSMYNWYSRADICITYLAETGTLPAMHKDRWFTRGWTLQELLAPRFTRFYDSNWKRLVDNPYNDMYDIRITAQIEQATTISKKELDSIRDTPISRRMQLAAMREVTREEDTAYSLMGVFDVSISTAYGEGAKRAFFRLLQEILTFNPNALDILNWAGDIPNSRPHVSRILPSSPLNYLKSYRYLFRYFRPVEPLTLTHLGLRVPVILMPAILIPGKASQYVPIGDYSGTVNISPVGDSWSAPKGTYNLLDNRISGADGRKEQGGYQLTLAVFSFFTFGDATSMFITKPCIAKVLKIYEDVGNVTSSSNYIITHTDTPVVFDLTNATVEDGLSEWNTISRDELGKHGMQLVSLDL